MRNFDRDNRNDTRGPRFGKKSFGPKKFGGDRGGDRSFGKPRFDRSERPMMHDAVCSQCGNDCQVPFKPNGRKPIFCSKCFEKQEGAGGGFAEKSFDRPRFGDREERAPRRFGSEAGAQKINDNLKEQLDEITSKLNRILTLLGEAAFESDDDSDEDESEDKPVNKKSYPKKAGQKKNKRKEF